MSSVPYLTSFYNFHFWNSKFMLSKKLFQFLIINIFCETFKIHLICFNRRLFLLEVYNKEAIIDGRLIDLSDGLFSTLGLCEIDKRILKISHGVGVNFKTCNCSIWFEDLCKISLIPISVKSFDIYSLCLSDSFIINIIWLRIFLFFVFADACQLCRFLIWLWFMIFMLLKESYFSIYLSTGRFCGFWDIDLLFDNFNHFFENIHLCLICDQLFADFTFLKKIKTFLAIEMLTWLCDSNFLSELLTILTL